jgi:hypothetical protein
MAQLHAACDRRFVQLCRVRSLESQVFEVVGSSVHAVLAVRAVSERTPVTERSKVQVIATIRFNWTTGRGSHARSAVQPAIP